MIPWSEVDGTNRYEDAIYPVDLQEHWLRLVENGPSMAMWALESSMLELAHERQFVVSQQGDDSVGFEKEHVNRIKLCMTVLDQTFRDGAGWKWCDFHDPPDVDCVGLWVDDQSLDLPTALDISEDESMVDAFKPALDRIVHSSVTNMCNSPQYPRTQLSSLPVRFRDGEMCEMDQESGDGTPRSVIRFSRATGASRTLQSQPIRALKPVRLRRRLGDQKKQASNGVNKTNHIQLLSNKAYLHRPGHARNALVLVSANSLSTPPASSPDDLEYDKLAT